MKWPAVLLLLSVCDALTIGVVWPSNDTLDAGLMHALGAAVIGHRTATANPGYAVNFRGIGDVPSSAVGVQSGLASLLAAGDLVGLIGGTSMHVLQAAPAASRHMLPLLAPIATAQELNDIPFVRPVLPANDAQARALIAVVKGLASEAVISLSRIAVLSSSDPYGSDLLQAFLTAAVQAQVRVDLTNVIRPADLALPDSTFELLFLRPLSVRSIQCVLLLTDFQTTIAILRRTKGYFAGRVWLGADTISNVADFAGSQNATGLLAIRPNAPTMPSSFVSDWFNQHGSWVEPSLYVKATYVAARVLMQAAGAVPNLNTYSVPCALQATPWAQGPDVMANVHSLTAVGGPFTIPAVDPSAAAFTVVNLQRAGLTVQWNTVGNVSADGGLDLRTDRITYTQDVMPTSEELLRGRRLHILFVEDPRGIPMCLNRTSSSSVVRDSYGQHCAGEEDDLCGLLPDLVRKLRDNLGFTFTWETQVGGWNTAMRLLAEVNSSYDMVASSSPVTAEREEIVDFAYPYLTTSYALLVKPTPTSESIWRFLRPFHWEVWLTFGFTLLVFSVIFYFLERDHNQYVKSKRDIYANFGGMQNALWFAFSSLFAVQDGAPKTHAGRLASAGYFFVTFMFAATYTAELLVFLQKKSGDAYDVESVNDFERIGTDEDESIGSESLRGLVVDAGGVYEKWVRDNTQNATGYLVSGGSTDSFEMVSNGSAKATIYFKMYSTYAREFTNCSIDLAPAPLVGNVLGVGLAFQRGSLFVPAVSSAIVTLQSENWIETVKRRWLFGNKCKSVQTNEEEQLEKDLLATGMRIDAVGGVFIVCGTILLLAIAMRIGRYAVLPYCPEWCRNSVALVTTEDQEEQEERDAASRSPSVCMMHGSCAGMSASGRSPRPMFFDRPTSPCSDMQQTVRQTPGRTSFSSQGAGGWVRSTEPFETTPMSPVDDSIKREMTESMDRDRDDPPPTPVHQSTHDDLLPATLPDIAQAEPESVCWLRSGPGGGVLCVGANSGAEPPLRAPDEDPPKSVEELPQV
eukprot:TRINITY_DN29892_c0_g1_i1.p1 TRINITY_DN29892_c0_g1~~TRINITY_DN29892_c0_g1_i1.p1  ORF type:complete len:1027 (+),score=331.67 TRINITY_DN29892_c0_g1_i1:55-3135(+)